MPTEAVHQTCNIYDVLRSVVAKYVVTHPELVGPCAETAFEICYYLGRIPEAEVLRAFYVLAYVKHAHRKSLRRFVDSGVVSISQRPAG